MKAMILAAGLGTRMRPLTLHTPKPLLQVNGIPLIEYHIGRLRDAGVTELVINHAWLGEQLEACLGSGERLGVSIRYSAEKEPLETAGGIRKALDLLCDAENQRFVIINGDVFTNYPFANLLTQKRYANHLVLVPNPAHNPEGDFGLHEDKVTTATDVRYTFSGISVLNAGLFRHLAENQPAPLAPLLRQAIARGEVGGELFTGYWADIGTPERLQEIDRSVREQQIDGL